MSDRSNYALGYSAGEHDRLARQAERLRPLTERFFRSAGLREGYRVLDLGSGIGDVAMLVARIVGSQGEVVGIERDHVSVERARVRAAEAGHRNVSVLEADVAAIPPCGRFDAVVGRFVLQFLPDPLGALRSLSAVLRDAGVVAFQEVSYAPSLALTSHLPLWSAATAAARDEMIAAGANPESGSGLYRLLTNAGFPAPTVTVDMQIGASPELVLWPPDLLMSLRPGMAAGRGIDALGDLETLAGRLQKEVALAQSAVPSVAVVSAWTSLR